MRKISAIVLSSLLTYGLLPQWTLAQKTTDKQPRLLYRVMHHLFQPHRRCSPPLNFFALLPDELVERILVLAMEESPESIPQIRAIHPQANRVFLAHQKTILPYPYDLYPGREQWIQQALTAAQQGYEPEHLTKFLSWERKLLHHTMRRKAAELPSTPQAWVQHGVSMIATWDAIWANIGALASDIAWEVAKTATSSATYNQIACDLTWRIARESSWSAGWNAVRCATWSSAWQHPSWEEACTAACVTSSTMKPLAYAELKQATATAIGQLPPTDPEHIAKASYYVAHTLSWLTFLDPRQQVAPKTYAAAYTQLASAPTADPENWFQPGSNLEHNIAKYFGPHSDLGREEEQALSSTEYLHRCRYVEAYLEELRSIHQQIQALSP
ncbi:MAG: hypothetical protein OXT67_01695 [Zetaproteobacteria bacterium]|nr:hypothetical protein [Zetaproteobacteria bacterium]